MLERFSRFGLPLHFTEVTLISGKLMPPYIKDLNDYKPESWPSTVECEERQAMEATLFYKMLFAHPLVEAITCGISLILLLGLAHQQDLLQKTEG